MQVAERLVEILEENGYKTFDDVYKECILYSAK